MLGISNFGGKEWRTAMGKGGRQGVNDPQALKHSFDFQQTSDASFSAAPIRSCIPAFHDNSAMSFPLFRVVYPPDFDVDADATTTFDYIWKPNSAANCVGIPATDGRPDQKPCLNHGLRTVCPSPVAPKTNIFPRPPWVLIATRNAAQNSIRDGDRRFTALTNQHDPKRIRPKN